MKRRTTHFKGYSLIEVIIAVALLSLLSLTATSILMVSLQAEKRNAAISAVDREANFALYQISQAVRNATVINTPSTSATSSTLSLQVAGSASPVIFALSGNTLTENTGSGASQLTTGDVKVTQFSVSNLSVSGTDGSFRVVLTLSAANPAGTSYQNFSRTYYATVTLR